MRQIVNFIITGLVLLVAVIFFPKYVQVSSIWIFLLTIVLLYVAEIVSVLVYFSLVVSACLVRFWAGVIVAISMIFVIELFAVSLVDLWLPGLTIVGFWPKFFIALALSIFRLPEAD